jgi:hypothetical protein
MLDVGKRLGYTQKYCRFKGFETVPFEYNARISILFSCIMKQIITLQLLLLMMIVCIGGSLRKHGGGGRCFNWIIIVMHHMNQIWWWCIRVVNVSVVVTGITNLGSKN